MQSSVERSAVRVAAWALIGVGLVYLILALVSGDWEWWVVSGETAALAVVGFAQLRTGRISVPFLWLLIVGATTMSGHFVSDPHQTAIGMAVAGVSAVGWVLIESIRRRVVLALMVAMWASQAVFPGVGFGLMIYEAGLFILLSAGLRSIGAAMERSQDRYQRLFERAPIALWEEDFSQVDRWLHRLRRIGVQDLRTLLLTRPEQLDRALGLVRVLNVNAAAAALIGVDDPSSMLGPIDPSTYTDETRPAFLEQVMAVWEGRSEMTTELRGQSVSGRPIQAIMRWAAPPGPHGMADYGRVVVSIDDVSELKEAERDLAAAHEALAAREGQLRAVVSGAPVVLFAIDAEGVYTLAEGSGLANLGQRGADIVGTSCFDRNAEFPEVLDEIRRALAGEEVLSQSEWQGRVWEVRRKPMIDADGGVGGVIGVATDITERREMEQALEAARRRNRLIVRNVSDLLLSLDAEGVVGFVSPSVEATWGRTPAEVVGMSIADLVHPDDISEVVAAAMATAPGESTASVPFRARRADGTWIAMEARATNLLGDPELRCWVITARDVTEQVEARRQLEEALHAAEAATRAKSELLANVSHEIRTPMNAILGMTDLALDTSLSQEQHDYMTTVRTSAESLLTIINDLLDLARIEAGRLVVEKVPFSLTSTLEDVVRTMRVRAQQKGIGLQVNVDERLPNWVAGDPGRLRQVVMNLVGNAVKFTDAGSVTITASPDEGPLVRFTVEDTGIGIDPEHLSAIFDAFEQVDGSMTRRHGGTGLGLAISSKLVDAMGGTISVESTVDRGSRFSFTAYLEPADALSAVGGAGMAGGPVLVIAGRPARERLVGMAAGAGYEAIGVASAFEAQTMAASLLADGRRLGALIVDFNEPDIEYCRRLVGAEVLAGTPLLAVVAAGRRGDGARFRSAGVRAYLTRPLEESDLREALGAIASGSAAPGILITRHWLRERRRPLQVLLADDSATNRLLAVRILEKRGHHLTQVSDGIAATQAVLEREFDVVLMDVQMPGMDGLDATRVIRAREKEQGADRVPIIALTAHAMESDRQRCLAAGMDGYLAKPFGAADLVSAVEAGAGVGPITRAVGVEVAGGFVEAYPSLIDRLEDAVAAGRLPEAAGLATRLAVGLGRIGAGEAAAAAGRLAEARADASADLAGDFARLAAYLDRVEPELGLLGGGASN